MAIHREKENVRGVGTDRLPRSRLGSMSIKFLFGCCVSVGKLFYQLHGHLVDY